MMAVKSVSKGKKVGGGGVWSRTDFHGKEPVGSNKLSIIKTVALLIRAISTSHRAG